MALPAVLTLAMALHRSGPPVLPSPFQSLLPVVTEPVPVRAPASEVRPGLASTAVPALVADAAIPVSALKTTLSVALEHANAALASTSSVPAPMPLPESQPAAETVAARTSLQQLLDAQARVATAQLTLQLLLQPVTPEQVSAAEAAAATAAADLTQALGAPSTAPPTTAPPAQLTSADTPTLADGVSAAQYAQAQQAVADAQAAVAQAEQPHSDDAMYLAQAQLAQAKRALADAQATRLGASAPRTTAVAGAELAPTPGAQASVAGGTLPQPDGATVGAFTTAGECSSPACGTADRGTGGQVAPATTATASAAPSAAAVVPGTPATTSRAPQPASQLEGHSSSAGSDAGGDIGLLQQRVAAAQQRVDVETAPPDAGQVQAARTQLAQAQQELASLLAPVVSAAPGSATAFQSGTGLAGTPPSDAEASSATETAVGGEPAAADAVQFAQSRLMQAQQLLALLRQNPAPSIIAAVQAEVDAATQDFHALYGQADAAIQSQIAADPRSALGLNAERGIPGLPDIARAIGTRYLSASLAEVFVQQIAVESGNFSPDIIAGRTVSPAGAAGIAQLLPSSYPDVNPLNPVASLVSAAGTMHDNLVQYGGDLRKALAAYNAGSGRVDAAVARRGAGWEADLPSETRLYLTLIVGPAGN